VHAVPLDTPHGRNGLAARLAVLLVSLMLLLAGAAIPASANGFTGSDLRLDNGTFFFGDPADGGSITEEGVLRQPFWSVPQLEDPLAFTYDNYPLNFAMQWTNADGTVKNEILSNADDNTRTTGFTARDFTSRSVSGTSTRLTFVGTTDGTPSLKVTHVYTLIGATVLKVETTVEAIGAQAKDVFLWFGTQDDYLGDESNDDIEPDLPQKTKGNYNFGGSGIPASGADLTRFTQITNPTDDSNAILIFTYNTETNEAEGEWVLFASPAPASSVNTIIGGDQSGALLDFGLDIVRVDPTTSEIQVVADSSYGMRLTFGDITAGATKSVEWYYAVGSTRFGAATPTPAATRHPIELVCSPDPVAPGGTVTCEITGGDPNVDILWSASYNPTFAVQGVTLDADGRATFTFVAPRPAQGQPITVELVEWDRTATVQVTGAALPVRVSAGEGQGALPLVLTLGSLVLLAGGAAMRLRRAGAAA
jgi:hypothetical protein